MGYNSPPEPAKLLYNCVLRKYQQPIEEVEITYSELEECIDRCELPEHSFTTLSRAFEETTSKRCTTCNSAPELCECASPKYKEEKRLTPIVEEIFQFWTTWLEETRIFEEISVKTRSESQLTLTARFGESAITIYAFSSADKCINHEYNHNTLEFGVYFPGPVGHLSEDYLYSWYDFLEEGFEEAFTEDFESLQTAYGARVYDYDQIDDIRGRIEDGIVSYLNDSDYSVTTQIGGARTDREQWSSCQGLSKYIDTSSADFAGANGDQCLVVCHCEKVAGWHIHRFEKGQIEPAGELEIVKEIRDKVKEKVNNYRDISDSQKGATNLSKVLSLYAAFIGTTLMFDKLSEIANYINNIPLVQLGNLSYLLLIINTLVLIFLGYLLIAPHYKLIRFSWNL